jgi:hypothetical protein
MHLASGVVEIVDGARARAFRAAGMAAPPEKTRVRYSATLWTNVQARAGACPAAARECPVRLTPHAAAALQFTAAKLSRATALRMHAVKDALVRCLPPFPPRGRRPSPRPG